MASLVLEVWNRGDLFVEVVQEDLTNHPGINTSFKMRRVVVLENIEIVPLHTHPWHKVLVLTVAPSSSSSSSQQSLHNMVLMWLPSSPTPVVEAVVAVVAVVEVVVESPF